MAKDYDIYRKLEIEHSKVKKELQQEKEESKRLRAGISKLKEELKDIKPAKNSQRIKELRQQLEEQEGLNRALHDTIYSLEQEKKQLLQGKEMVSQSEYDGLLKQLERERQAKEQYQRLYEQEKAKRNELKESFITENKNRNAIYAPDEENKTLAIRIKELEAKLSRKGTGRPRNNKASDEDVLKLRNEGKKYTGYMRHNGNEYGYGRENT